ncbi:hypothetical protein N836_26010 [Leptolyngbya sp. Heron Island J]|uniref:BREX-6 system BrxE protein n=1 Tax=Leptolyngbya sp. Heron Island J TaxID=1385935 RepID=UPI0003B99425|nr:BREX-6 system BrxE protein [Leptolyngbya sp. Heron Island J]ESA32464.1 hypothetical protein N836_26010 [Leptolyngbya sp. Heron Island J]
MGNVDPTTQELTLSKQPIADSVLDSILVWQFVVAWAGESLCEPSRLGWWRTDLIDKDGGGDFLQRLLPKTYLWASLEAVREAAIRTDQQKRQRLAQADQVNTLFFWGFELDEKLQDRLAVHKRGQKSPADRLDLPLELGAEFDPADLKAVLTRPGSDNGKGYKLVSEGRAMQGVPPQSLDLRAKHLAAALLPFTDSYPMPFYPMVADREANHGK